MGSINDYSVLGCFVKYYERKTPLKCSNGWILISLLFNKRKQK